MARGNTIIRNSSRRLDIFHIVLGIIIIVMAILAFIDPKENMVLFPLIFFSAALLKIISAVSTLRTGDHDRKKTTQGFLQLLAGVLILGVGIVSAVSIWF